MLKGCELVVKNKEEEAIQFIESNLTAASSQEHCFLLLQLLLNHRACRAVFSSCRGVREGSPGPVQPPAAPHPDEGRPVPLLRRLPQPPEPEDRGEVIVVRFPHV